MAIDGQSLVVDTELQRPVSGDEVVVDTDVVTLALADEVLPPKFLEVKEFDLETRKRVKNRVY